MVEQAHKAKGSAAPLGPRVKHLVVELIKRTYAIGIILLTSWLSYLALRYLIVTLMVPQPAPEQIVGIPKRLSEEVIQTRREEWPGVQVSENPRIPLAHYHRIEGWIQPDAYNNCTRSGCHFPLPHARSKEVRAFLNMHATSIHCGVCHMTSESRPLATTWYALDTGKQQAAPTVLELFGWMMSEEGQTALANPTREVQDRIVARLSEAAAEAGDDRALRKLAEHFASVHPDSTAFQRLVEEARTTLPRHFRGEYGAKLALLDQDGEMLLGHPENAEAVSKYLALGEDASMAEKAQLLPQIHTRRRKAALHCTDCHREEDRLLDFAAAGYPEERVEMLFGPVVFRMIEHISEGSQFYLPEFMPPDEEPAGLQEMLGAPVEEAGQ